MALMKFLGELEKDIQGAYESSPTIEEAEFLAAKFLNAQIQCSKELRVLGLDARMRKSGMKALRSKLYLDEVSKAEKKPSDVLLDATVTSNSLVVSEQSGLDESEEARDEIERYFSIFREAHIYFRGLAKGGM